ncbi:hypothetical protein PN36_32595 [Candidatus Thiomargarita nelsonii]|uniref:Uncharacterized protein n=1 Tax=Candidatus Thiomargarita nelsonii TaxID=1003181 RepID=A0A0A6P324_9GAMM|nr:hypothetical protein PN36_32595 [Candidatus Thiomargarita nelsonii]
MDVGSSELLQGLERENIVFKILAQVIGLNEHGYHLLSARRGFKSRPQTLMVNGYQKYQIKSKK